MARKRFNPKLDTGRDSDAYRQFLVDLFAKKIAAVALIETRPGGRLRLDYDEPPNGQATRGKGDA